MRGKRFCDSIAIVMKLLSFDRKTISMKITNGIRNLQLLNEEAVNERIKHTVRETDKKKKPEIIAMNESRACKW